MAYGILLISSFPTSGVLFLILNSFSNYDLVHILPNWEYFLKPSGDISDPLLFDPSFFQLLFVSGKKIYSRINRMNVEVVCFLFSSI